MNATPPLPRSLAVGFPRRSAAPREASWLVVLGLAIALAPLVLVAAALWPALGPEGGR